MPTEARAGGLVSARRLTYRHYFVHDVPAFEKKAPRRRSAAWRGAASLSRKPTNWANGGFLLAAFQFEGVAARSIVHNPRKVTIGLRFRAADATAARLLPRNRGTEKVVVGLASRKDRWRCL